MQSCDKPDDLIHRILFDLSGMTVEEINKITALWKSVGYQSYNDLSASDRLKCNGMILGTWIVDCSSQSKVWGTVSPHGLIGELFIYGHYKGPDQSIALGISHLSQLCTDRTNDTLNNIGGFDGYAD